MPRRSHARLRICVFRDHFGVVSESFIVRQAEAFARSDVTLLGIKATPVDVALPLQTVGGTAPARRIEAARFALTYRSGRLRRLLEASSPDLVLAHFATDAWRVSHLTSEMGIPLVVVAHGSDVLVQPSKAKNLGIAGRQLARNWERLAARGDCFLAVSRFVAETLMARGVPESKVRTHYLGVEIPECPLPRTPKRWDLIFVGRLVENKGVLEFLRAVFAASAQLPRVRALIVGTGPEEVDVRRHLSRKPENVSVDLAGAVPAPKVAELIRQARLLCAPSVKRHDGASEGFGLAAVEAQANGVPVVVYDTGGLGETCVDGVTGVVVPQRNTDELGNTLVALLSDSSRLADLGDRGRAWAASYMNVRTQTAILEEFLRSRYL